MKPTKELIRSLTPAQKRAIEKIQQEGSYRRYDPAGFSLMDSLETLGIVRLKPGTAGMNVFVLERGWHEVNLEVPDRIRQQAPVRDDIPVIPDPPKRKWPRPAAIYNNRTREELIDHILKNY